MDTATLREKVRDDIMTLPEDALRTVNEFVIFQKNRHGIRLNDPGRLSDAEKARRAAGFEILMKYRGTLNRKIDVKKEKCEALDEKYKGSL